MPVLFTLFALSAAIYCVNCLTKKEKYLFIIPPLMFNALLNKDIYLFVHPLRLVKRIFRVDCSKFGLSSSEKNA